VLVPLPSSNSASSAEQKDPEFRGLLFALIHFEKLSQIGPEAVEKNVEEIAAPKRNSLKK
jgi:hypothetical protein